MHNKYRKDHHVQELELNKELCEISKKYAKQKKIYFNILMQDLKGLQWEKIYLWPMGLNQLQRML